MSPEYQFKSRYQGIFISAFLLVVHSVYLAAVSESCSLFVTVTVFCVHHSTPIQSIVTIALLYNMMSVISNFRVRLLRCQMETRRVLFSKLSMRIMFSVGFRLDIGMQTEAGKFTSVTTCIYISTCCTGAV